MGSSLFVESFVVEVFHEDLGTMSNLLMLVDPHTAFVMFLLCYMQHLCYLLRIVFPFPNILQHYAKFNIHTITTLEKLLGAGTFCGSINHLICRQAIFPTSLGGFDLPSMV
jgi:hypothetical protein